MNYLAVDIGGTEVKIGLVNDQGEVLAKTSVPANFDNYETPLLEVALNGSVRFTETLAAKEAAEFGHPDNLPVRAEEVKAAAAQLGICGIGISTTGMIDKIRGRVAGAAGHIPHYQGAELKKEFEALFGLETHVINDANSVAVAEHWTGSAKGCDNALILTLGTGIGGGIIVNGKILEGAHGYAGEVGHITVKKDGPMTPCGNRGTFEFYGATKALVRKAEERYRAAGLPVPDRGLNGKMIFEAAAQGSETARGLLQEWISDISVGIIDLIYIFDPEIVVIGGGVSAQEEMLIRPLEEKVRADLMPVFAEKLRMVPAAHHNDAGMIGAVRSFVE